MTFAAKLTNIRMKPKLEGLRRKDDIFAEYLACGFDMKDAAERMGKTYAYGNALLQRSKKAIGDQAV